MGRIGWKRRIQSTITGSIILFDQLSVNRESAESQGQSETLLRLKDLGAKIDIPWLAVTGGVLLIRHE